MQLVRYNPQREMTRLERDLDKAFRGFWDLPVVFQDLSAVDMYTENEKLVVQVTLPGFTKEEIKLNASGDTLGITAEHAEKDEKDAKRAYLLRESSRSYQRQVTLPDGAKADEAEAEFTNGTLTVTMPLSKKLEGKELTIK